MESARRASEIHRKRSGRAFRITEEAVLNEEMYEEEDPDYGLRVSRLSGLYASLAHDASMIQQHWYPGQRMRFDPTTNQFIMNPFMQNMGPNMSSMQQGAPFFAYQPGAQPTSAPIRAEQSADFSQAGQDDAPLSASPNFFQVPNSESQDKSSMMPGLYDESPNPTSAQLNLFTYPIPDFTDFNMSNFYGGNMNQSTMMDQSPISPGHNPNSSDQSFAQLMNNDQFSHMSESGNTPIDDSFATSKPSSRSYTPAVPDHASFLDMQEKLMSHPSKQSANSTPTLKAEDSFEASYNDWLSIPSSQN
jgi:hypothetical protein